MAHDPQDPLVVYSPPFALERRRNPTVAVAGKLQDDPLYGVPEHHVLSRLLFGRRMFVVPRAADAHQLAEPLDGQLRVLFLDPGDHGMPLGECILFSDFFRIWFSRDSCPQKRSSSAILASKVSSPEGCLSANAASPRASYSLRHLKSTLSERLCSRQIWAGRFSPVATCRQHSSLNSLVWFLLNYSSLIWM